MTPAAADDPEPIEDEDEPRAADGRVPGRRGLLEECLRLGDDRLGDAALAEDGAGRLAVGGDAPVTQRDEGIVADHEVVEHLDVQQAAGSQRFGGQVVRAGLDILLKACGRDLGHAQDALGDAQGRHEHRAQQ